MRKLHALWIAVCVGACATYREDLDRGQRFYEENRYDHALASWRALEPDLDSLEHPDQARYAYLRGMTDYRLGLRSDARHWLGLASAIDERHPSGLTEQRRQQLKETLAELNAEVWGKASNALGTAPPSSNDGTDATPSTPSDDASEEAPTPVPPQDSAS